MPVEPMYSDALPELIKKRIFSSFKGTTLQGGTGFFEACAIDGHIEKDSEEYRAQKSADSPDDWTKLVPKLEKFSDSDPLNFFMDARGLYYYLPVFMLTGLVIESVLHNMCAALSSSPNDSMDPEWSVIESDKEKYIQLYKMLTPTQKSCIFDYMEFEANYINTVICHQVEDGKPLNEALIEAANSRDCRPFLLLAKHLRPTEWNHSQIDRCEELNAKP